MQRLFQILAIISTLLILTACGGSGSTSSTDTASQTVSATDSINLSWIPPTTRADGSFLETSELAGYRIYMGTSSNELTPIIDLVNDNITQYQVENLTTGSYYFAITAYDQDGVESSLSQVVLINLT